MPVVNKSDRRCNFALFQPFCHEFNKAFRYIIVNIHLCIAGKLDSIGFIGIESKN